MPALMVTTGKDPVLLPVFSKGMENMVRTHTHTYTLTKYMSIIHNDVISSSVRFPI